MSKIKYVFGGMVCGMVAASVLALVQVYQPVVIPDQLPPLVETHTYDAGTTVKDASVIILPEMTIVGDKPARSISQKRVVDGALYLHSISNQAGWLDQPLRQHDPSNSFEYHSN